MVQIRRVSEGTYYSKRDTTPFDKSSSIYPARITMIKHCTRNDTIDWLFVTTLTIICALLIILV